MNLRGAGFLLIILVGIPFTLGGAAYLDWSINEYYLLSSGLVSPPVVTCATTETSNLVQTYPCQFTVAYAVDYVIASTILLLLGILFIIVGVRMFRRHPNTKKEPAFTTKGGTAN